MAVDIGPEFARGAGHVGLAGQIFAAFDDRRGEAEIEAEQARLLGRAGRAASRRPRRATRHGRAGPGAAPPRRALRQSRCPCACLPFAPDQSIATKASKRSSHQWRLAVLGIGPSACRANPARRRRRARTGGRPPFDPSVERARRRVAPAEPEGERRRDRGRAEDQPERHHHDLVGKAHEGQADRGEQGDDRIADDVWA